MCSLQTLVVPKPVGFNYDIWESELASYDDAPYILQGIHDGFDIGLMDNPPEPTHIDNPTLPTTLKMDEWITNWILKSVTKGFLLGPFTEQTVPIKNLVYSPLFAVPKPDLTWRIICHLSHPRRWGVSVNDMIDDVYKHVTYMSFTELVKFVYDLGHDARIWAVDAKDAYYRVPIKSKYWRYMGIKWYGKTFIMTSLQMGLGSACQIYQRFADSILYIICNSRHPKFGYVFYDRSIRLAHHYLDDFFGGSWDQEVAKIQFELTYEWFERLGIPTQLNKLKPPNWVQILLGWKFDTRARTVSLPDSKVEKYFGLVVQLIRSGRADKKQLEQLTGILHHASNVIYPGKAFVRRLEQVLHLELLDYETTVELSNFVLEDLKWWKHALKFMNEVPMRWLIRKFNDPDIYVWTDASTSIGIGGCSSVGKALQVLNRQTFFKHVKRVRKGIDIHFLELLILLVVAKMWAHEWTDKYIYFYCDNPGATGALANKRAELGRIGMNFMCREFCKLAYVHRFRFHVEHVPGDDNEVADELSRFKYEYCQRVGDFKNFQFETEWDVKTCVNQIYSDILKLPLNYDNTSMRVLKRRNRKVD